MSLSDIGGVDIRDVGEWTKIQKALAICSLCASVIFLGYWFDTSEQIREVRDLEKKEESLKEELKIKAVKAANLSEYENQLAQMQVSFGSMLRQLPSKSEVADLLVEISQSGLASGLEFEMFKPMPEIKRDFYVEMPISMKVVGTYHEFGNFIGAISALPRIVTVGDVDISGKTEARGADDLMRMELTASTYWYVDGDDAGGKHAKNK